MFKKMRQIAAALIFLVCATNSAVFAQAAFSQNEKTDPIIGAHFYNGVETSPGFYDSNTGLLYGNTHILSSTGESETYHLTISINRFMILHVGDNDLPITGGSWSLIKYSSEGQYLGTLYGDVTSGFVESIESNDRNKTRQRTYAVLKPKGYFHPFYQLRNGLVKGVLEITTETNSLLSSGTLSLQF